MVILVKGEYIVFTEYNLELFYDFHGFPPSKGNIDLATTTIRYPLKSVDFTGNLGLAFDEYWSRSYTHTKYICSTIYSI